MPGKEEIWGWGACTATRVDDDRGGGQGLCPTQGAKKGAPIGGEQGLLGADVLRRRRDAWKNPWALLLSSNFENE